MSIHCTGIHESESMTKSELEVVLRNNDLNKLRTALEAKPGVMRKLMGFLYHPELEVRDAAARGFGVVAQVYPMEKLKDLLRRMMWMLNDESGSCCWHIPYAVGEIGYSNPEAIDDFLGCFSYYANDPDETMSTGVRRALERIHESGYKFNPDGYVVFKPKKR